MGGNFAREWCGFTIHTVSGAAQFAFFFIWFKNSILSPFGDAHPRGPACDERHLRARQECHHTHLVRRQLAVTAPSTRDGEKDGGTSRTSVVHPEQPPVGQSEQDSDPQAHRPQVEQC